eukprot:749554-Hanusia_phi.AAC.1
MMAPQQSRVPGSAETVPSRDHYQTIVVTSERSKFRAARPTSSIRFLSTVGVRPPGRARPGPAE